MKTKTYPENYTADLAARMAKANVTRAMLADAAGVNPSQISRWFNTAMQPSLKNVAILEKAFERAAKLVAKELARKARRGL